MVALLKHEVDGHDMFMLHELVPVDGANAGEALIEVQDENGVVTKYRTVAQRFEDTVTSWLPTDPPNSGIS